MEEAGLLRRVRPSFEYKSHRTALRDRVFSFGALRRWFFGRRPRAGMASISKPVDANLHNWKMFGIGELWRRFFDRTPEAPQKTIVERHSPARYCGYCGQGLQR
jgi:hypothetical protein